MKKILILSIFFYILTLIHSSFLVQFSAFRIIPNLVLISVILLNLFEGPQTFTGVFAAFVGGFCLDLFSQNISLTFPITFEFWGENILILVISAIFIKLILKPNVRIPAIKV